MASTSDSRLQTPVPQAAKAPPLSPNLPPATGKVPLALPPGASSQANPLGKPFLVDVFAGSARLSRASRSLGWDVVALDWKCNRHTPTVPIVLLDLSSAEGQAALWAILQRPSVAHVHFGPPCGTFTLSSHRKPKVRGLPAPSQLRDAEHVRGFPICQKPGCLGASDGCVRALHGRDVKKVEAANNLLDLTAAAVAWLRSERPATTWSIENPSKDMIWDWPGMPQPTSAFSEHGAGSIDRSACVDVFWEDCMFGGGRDKTARMRSNLPITSSLSLRCRGEESHPPRAQDADGKPLLHLPWSAALCRRRSALATSEETSYQDALCLALASLFVEAHRPRYPNRSLKIDAMGTQSQPGQPPRGCLPHATARAQAIATAKGAVASGRQPRGRAIGPLVPEYKATPCTTHYFKAVKKMAPVPRSQAGCQPGT